MNRLVRSRQLGSILEAIGNTPIVRLEKVARSAPSVEVYLKLEFANPGGSVKDRPALRMVQDALSDGRLTSDKILIDSTSGNTGVAYSLIGAAMGFRVQLVMPKNVTKARKDITQAFGTELIFSDPMEGSDGAIRLVREIVSKEPDKYFYPDQYSNPSNPLAHYHGTAAEILDALGDRITHFVTGLGTSGTMMGSTRRLHEHGRPVYCVAVEPAEALHGLEGLKHMASSIVPLIYDPELPDEILPVATEDGWDMSDRVAQEEGLNIGHSTGANIAGAVKIAERLHKEQGGGCVVTIAADRGDRYFAPMKWERRYSW
ncbi:MAG TPA: cysteine synthase family protein [Polyangiaceae bacterium]|jgi:cysteine synthase B|nr:cysteine synthase family protein [Polyangiaceae bacterium]